MKTRAFISPVVPPSTHQKGRCTENRWPRALHAALFKVTKGVATKQECYSRVNASLLPDGMVLPSSRRARGSLQITGKYVHLLSRCLNRSVLRHRIIALGRHQNIGMEAFDLPRTGQLGGCILGGTRRVATTTKGAIDSAEHETKLQITEILAMVSKKRIT